jgi:hypothetical protein
MDQRSFDVPEPAKDGSGIATDGAPIMTASKCMAFYSPKIRMLPHPFVASLVGWTFSAEAGSL